jgi:hypothetical protein
VSYTVELSETAAAELSALPLDLQSVVEVGLARLARDPLRYGRRVVSPPYPPGGQMYLFEHTAGTRVHNFVAFYVFGQDESTLVVTSIGHT